jgi:predicted nucleotidyltransferase
MTSQKFIISSIKKYKNRYIDDGIKIIGLFGSYARGEAKQNSDIDIVIETTPLFLKKYRGVRAFSRLLEIKNELQTLLEKEIDLVDKSALVKKKNLYKEIGKPYESRNRY